MDEQQREDFANDPLNLLAVQGTANQRKGDGDAATWLPSRKAYRCDYAARQVAVKQRHDLWVTPPEREALRRILSGCPDQSLPTASNTGVPSRGDS
ncbi:MAG: HNH endonuclease family protein [Janibacter sp.]